MTKKKVSRQREWARRQRALGNCMICGRLVHVASIGAELETRQVVALRNRHKLESRAVCVTHV